MCASPETASYQYAEICAQLGEPDEAFKWLDNALRVRDPGLSSLLFDPLVDPLRKDRRFNQLLSEIGLEPLAER